MTVHNILEEEVIERVNNIYNQAKEQGIAWLTCDCEQCRLDTTSYVLNRIPPKYIVSGRGMNHNVSSTDAQQKADMDSLIFEAMRIVSSVQRPFHAQNNKSSEEEAGEFYNFPTFIGSVFDGDTFEPLANASITIKMNNEIAPMIDHTWTNPCTTTKSTKATYSFWVKPQQAQDKSSIFNFSLEISAEGYESITYAFELPVMKEDKAKKSLNSTYSLKIQDLFLFKKV
jgi:competence protein ComFB